MKKLRKLKWRETLRTKKTNRSDSNRLHIGSAQAHSWYIIYLVYITYTVYMSLFTIVVGNNTFSNECVHKTKKNVIQNLFNYPDYWWLKSLMYICNVFVIYCADEIRIEHQIIEVVFYKDSDLIVSTNGGNTCHLFRGNQVNLNTQTSVLLRIGHLSLSVLPSSDSERGDKISWSGSRQTNLFTHNWRHSLFLVKDTFINNCDVSESYSAE